ncbi:MAG: TraB/GumN family protein [Ruminococcaceae bacterium]|nr:TraB/GumN family protein [Oscillospiraceae bacterium]
MRLKKFLCWLLILALCFSLIACDNKVSKKSEDTPATKEVVTEKTETEGGTPTAETDSDPDTEEEGITPLLYQVTDDRGNKIWLFGSVHVGQEEFYPLPDYVMDAFENADSLAVEADIIAFEADLSGQVQALMPMLYKDGSKITDHIPEELYKKCVDIMKEGDLYVSALDHYMPAFWQIALNSLFYQEIEIDVELGIERHLLELAKDEDMEILEIESAAFQYEMFASFSEELQILLLEQAVAMFESPTINKLALSLLINFWKNGNEAGLERSLRSEGAMNDEEKELYEEYTEAMITKRNLSMASFAEDALESGEEVFICVGAAHVVGADAMVDILQDRGYTVECVSP